MANLVWLSAALLGILPVVQHLIFGFSERRREILDYFDDTSIRLYFQRFFSAKTADLDCKPGALRDLYKQRFGRIQLYFRRFFSAQTAVLDGKPGAALRDLYQSYRRRGSADTSAEQALQGLRRFWAE